MGSRRTRWNSRIPPTRTADEAWHGRPAITFFLLPFNRDFRGRPCSDRLTFAWRVSGSFRPVFRPESDRERDVIRFFNLQFFTHLSNDVFFGEKRMWWMNVISKWCCKYYMEYVVCELRWNMLFRMMCLCEFRLTSGISCVIDRTCAWCVYTTFVVSSRVNFVFSANVTRIPGESLRNDISRLLLVERDKLEKNAIQIQIQRVYFS